MTWRTSVRPYTAGVLIAGAVFLAVSLLCSARVMGLRYTVRRVGAGANFAGVIFGMFLLVLCALVAVWPPAYHRF